MSFLEIMNTYFRGEKLEALFFILPIGVLLVAFGVVALKVEHGGFAWGVAIPSFVFGLILAGTGIGVAARAPGQVAEMTSGFQSEPAAMVSKELPRMQKVNQNFKNTFIAGGVVTAIGLVLLFAVRTDWGKGVGSMLVLASALMFLIDGFASRRAVPYTAALEQISAEHESD